MCTSLGQYVSSCCLLFLLVHPGTAISLPVDGVNVRVRLLTGFGCGWISSWRPAQQCPERLDLVCVRTAFSSCGEKPTEVKGNFK